MICPACKSPEIKKIGNINTQEKKDAHKPLLVSCSTCDLLFLSDYDIDRSYIYNENYATWAADLEEAADTIGQAKTSAFEQQLQTLLNISGARGGHFLDIGTGPGYLMDVACQQGYDVYGLDISPHVTRILEERHPGKIHTGDLLSAEYPANFFKIIALTDLIEHLPHPRPFFDELRRIIAPGGYLFIITPDSDSLSRRWWGKNWFQYKYEHVIYWNKQSLANILRSADFEIIIKKPNRKRFSLAYYYFYFQKYNLAIIGPLFRRIYQLLPRRWQNWEFSNPITGEMLVVAQKKL
ncbi:MAG: class I SAM-dependent methyltransferase [Candidatus Komeilibacteria bacterium]|nr:class I SAM-dependent methyltransferase [Candidatus Komeilibacteria bacterium]